MKKTLVILLMVGWVLAAAGTAGASIYASSIVEGATAHNWVGGCHGDLDALVILGAPDNQLTGWGSGDSGWITLGFDSTLTDGDGDDLIIYGFGPGATELLVSTDNATWTSLGNLGTSMPGTVTAWGYDFADFGVASADYFKFVSGSAKFIDAIEGVNAVPIPAAAWLLGSGVLGLIGVRGKRR
jgi:hypothetical protein